ncbi:MAG: hypothetical protein GQ574_14955 [Crocinitomix sp.]|nr:hypothetical protein [Crocinitomix sp.]
MKIHAVNLGLSIAAISILFIDFFVINEFYIERGYLDVFSFLLILNIGRLALKNKIESRVFTLFVNLGLLGFLFYNLPTLAILCFGIGFTGRSFPLIMGLAIIVNLVFIGVLMIELINLIKTKAKLNES